MEPLDKKAIVLRLTPTSPGKFELVITKEDAHEFMLASLRCGLTLSQMLGNATMIGRCERELIERDANSTSLSVDKILDPMIEGLIGPTPEFREYIAPYGMTAEQVMKNPEKFLARKKAWDNRPPKQM